MKLIVGLGLALVVIVGFGQGGIVLMALGAAVLVVGKATPRRRAFSPALAHVHVDDADARKEARRVETHEVGGHMKFSRKVGGRPVRVNKYTVRPNLPKNAPMEHYVAFYHAGQVAQGSRLGCGPDEELEKYAASFAPNPGKCLRDGRALARRLV